MKKVLLCVTLLIGAISFAQVNTNRLSVYYGTTKSFGLEYSRSTNNILYGVGITHPSYNLTAMSSEGDVRNYKPALYVMPGYKFDKISLRSRLGISRGMDISTYTNHFTTNSEFMYGGVLSTEISKYFTIDTGYDNINDLTIGSTIKF